MHFIEAQISVLRLGDKNKAEENYDFCCYLESDDLSGSFFL